MKAEVEGLCSQGHPDSKEMLVCFYFVFVFFKYS